VDNYAVTLRAGAREDVYTRAALGGFRKRALDIIISSIALFVLAPLMFATTALVRLLMRRPMFVTDECIGFGGRKFVRYQFSSAVCERADKSSALLQLAEPSWAESLEGALRASGLDKLSLLFNVLRGDMSLIGPRPISVQQPSHYNRLTPEYLLARPGITGLWRRPRTKRRISQMALDRYYVRYWSVGLDLGLLIKAMSAIA
jgi:lipopolysaccharide/colanic/teichoic acid biosynthesis glycosyltransferase